MIVKKIVRSRSLLVRCLPYVIMIILFLLSSLSNNELPKINFKHIDKVEHFIAYFTLSFLWFLALKTSKVSFKKALIFAVLFTTMYGVFDELHQKFFTNDRTGDVFDLIADFLGATTSSILVYFRYRNDFKD